MPALPTDADYARLLALRTDLRRFLRWSEVRARDAGLTPMQHQLLLAIRGRRGGTATVGEVATSLLLRPHSATELVDRAEVAGLVTRHHDPGDGRVVRLTLTANAEERLARLSRQHLEELRRLGRRLAPIVDGLEAPEAGAAADRTH